jgi:hypothetical protein
VWSWATYIERNGLELSDEGDVNNLHGKKKSFGIK